MYVCVCVCVCVCVIRFLQLYYENCDVRQSDGPTKSSLKRQVVSATYICVSSVCSHLTANMLSWWQSFSDLSLPCTMCYIEPGYLRSSASNRCCMFIPEEPLKNISVTVSNLYSPLQ